MSEAKGRPDRNVIAGDLVYFKHPEQGVLSARVASAGEHGCTVEHECGKDGYHRVIWDDVLGHKERHVRKLKIVDRGEDGGIAEDEHGKRVFVGGELPDDEAEGEGDLEKAFSPPAAPVLVDIGHLHGPACDHALEGLHKALSGEDGIGLEIWEAHPNPFIRDLVEKFSKRGLLKLAKVQDELAGWMAGRYHVPDKMIPPPPPGFMGRWSQAELDLVRVYLEAINPAAMSYDDWGLVVDYMVQRYLPADALNEEAEWLSTKAFMLGKMQGTLGIIASEAAAALAEELPGTVDEAVRMFRYSDHAEAIMGYGRARACENVTAFADAARHRLKRTILEYQQKRLNGDGVSLSTLQTDLFDQFDYLNRDWRRIAVTEAGEMANQGVIASLPHGSRVRRLEAYNGACPFCRKLDGRIFRVTTADDPDKDGFADVWPGKTNVGRSVSPMKRQGSQLVPRAPDERWWAAAGTQHPHCRGRWEPMEAAQSTDDPDFAAWLRAKLGQHEGMPHE
jgi:hypothetical protein